MQLKNMSKEELQLLSYTDLASMVLNENKASMNTPTIFKKICDLLGYTDEEYTDKIGDFYTSLTIDKRFVLLDNHEWDLREKHAVTLVMDDEDDEDIEIDEENEEETDEIEEELEEINDDEDELDTDDDLDDLTVIDDEDDEDM